MPRLNWIFFTYAKPIGKDAVTALAKAKLTQKGLEQWQDLLTQSRTDTNRHFGSRIAFDDNGDVYISVGDRGERPNGQDLKTHAGSILRVDQNGKAKADNPFAKKDKALPD